MTALELPRALRPWAEPLAMLGPLAHDGLGRWLLPLQRLLGPLTLPRAASTGEPDGYAGLHRRGSYERLLLSEWVLALEAPDEFLRRAAAGEHVFIAPAFHEPQAASTSVALLDAGPRQLGAPRLLHLALLVVLQQRARAGGASFRFGVLQDDEASISELTPPAITRWVSGRSWQPAMSNAATWTTRMAELATPDAWLVGTGELRPLAQRMGAGLLEIEEITHDGAAALRVCAHPRARGSQTVTLPLPPPGDGLRILRAPLAPPPRPPRRGDDDALCTDQLGQISFDGRRWLLPFHNGNVGALHVPNTSAEPPGHTKVVPAQAGATTVAAVVLHKRPAVLAIADDGELLLRGSGLALGSGAARSSWNMQHTGIAAPESLQRPAAPRLLTLLVTETSSKSFVAWLLDDAAQLWALELQVDTERREVVHRSFAIRDRACRSLWQMDGSTVVWISDSEQRLLSSRALEGDDPPLTEAQRAGCVIGPLRANGHEGLRYAFPEGGMLQLRDFGSPGEKPRAIALPPGRAFGLRAYHGGARLGTLVPLYLGPDARTVWTHVQDVDQLLFTTSSPIAQIRYEPACDKIVWRTEHGELGVYDPQRQGMLRRFSSDGREVAKP